MSEPVGDVCPICWEEPLIPVLPKHSEIVADPGDPKRIRPACRTPFCEECVHACQNCPMCNLPMEGYIILAWRIPFDKPVECRQCDWTGRHQEYLTSHTFVHNPELKK